MEKLKSVEKCVTQETHKLLDKTDTIMVTWFKTEIDTTIKLNVTFDKKIIKDQVRTTSILQIGRDYQSSCTELEWNHMEKHLDYLQDKSNIDFTKYVFYGNLRFTMNENKKQTKNHTLSPYDKNCSVIVYYDAGWETSLKIGDEIYKIQFTRRPLKKKQIKSGVVKYGWKLIAKDRSYLGYSGGIAEWNNR